MSAEAEEAKQQTVECSVHVYKSWLDLKTFKVTTLKREVPIKVVAELMPKNFDERIMTAAIENRSITNEFNADLSWRFIEHVRDQVKAALNGAEDALQWAIEMQVIVFKNGLFRTLINDCTNIYNVETIGMHKDLPEAIAVKDFAAKTVSSYMKN